MNTRRNEGLEELGHKDCRTVIMQNRMDAGTLVDFTVKELRFVVSSRFLAFCVPFIDESKMQGFR